MNLHFESYEKFENESAKGKEKLYCLKLNPFQHTNFHLLLHEFPALKKRGAEGKNKYQENNVTKWI